MITACEYGESGGGELPPVDDIGEDIAFQEIPEAPSALEPEAVETSSELTEVPAETFTPESAPNMEETTTGEGESHEAAEVGPGEELLPMADYGDELTADVPDVPIEIPEDKATIDVADSSDQAADADGDGVAEEQGEQATGADGAAVVETSEQSDEAEVGDADSGHIEVGDEAVEIPENVDRGQATWSGVERESPIERGTVERPEITDSPESLPEKGLGRDQPPGHGIQPSDAQDDISDDDSATSDTSSSSEDQTDKAINLDADDEDLSDPRHQKGAELEKAYAEEIQKDEKNILLPGHEKVTEPGFDVVYYDKEKKAIVISEEKNWGDKENPSTVSDISALNEENLDTNLNKLIERIGDSEESDDKTKEDMLEAIIEDRIEFELVGGPGTKFSPRTVEKYSADRVVTLDPKDRANMRVEETVKGS